MMKGIDFKGFLSGALSVLVKLRKYLRLTRDLLRDKYGPENCSEFELTYVVKMKTRRPYERDSSLRF